MTAGQTAYDTLLGTPRPAPPPRRRSRSSAKQAGTRAETAVVRYLRSRGWTGAERRAKTGAKDQGDIAGLPGTVIEVKDCVRLDLAGWLAEAETERVNAGADTALVWHKRRGKSDPGEWYVTMTGHQLVALLAAAEGFRPAGGDAA